MAAFKNKFNLTQNFSYTKCPAKYKIQYNDSIEGTRFWEPQTECSDYYNQFNHVNVFYTLNKLN